MTTRAMGPAAGWRWLKYGINLGRHNPKAIFGGAAWLLVSVLLLAVGLSLLVGVLLAAMQPGGGGSMALSLLITVPILLVMAGLMVGYLRLMDAVEAGRPARAGDVFNAFRDMPTSLRAIGFVLLLAVVQNMLVLGLIAMLAPEFGSWYMQTMQTSMGGSAPPQMTALPAGFGIAFAIILLLGLFGYAVQAIGLGQIALRARSVFGAVTDGLTGSAKNLLPLLVLTLIVVVGSIILALAAALVVLVIGLLMKIAGGWLGILIGVPLYLIALVVAFVIMLGVMYAFWRDVCGDGTTAPTTTDNQIAL